MEALWNKMDLGHPINNSWHASVDEFDVTGFVKAIENVISELESQDVLQVEAAILSRLIYRMKTKFRTDKGLKNMEKVNRALLNYLALTLHNEYKSLKNSVELDGDIVHLPTQQKLQYVLVRTQGFAKLMCRVEDVAGCAGSFLKARIILGHAWTMSIIAYAVISRIWVLSRYLVKRCCVWYNSIYQYLNKLKPIGIAWLPDNYSLPRNLKTWLDVPWIDKEMESVPTRDPRLDKETIFSLISAQTDDSQETLKFDIVQVDGVSQPTTQSIYIKEGERAVSKSVPKIEDEFQLNETHNNSFLMDDIGESIDRTLFKSNVDSERLSTEASVVSEDNTKKLESNNCRNNNNTVRKNKRKIAISVDESISDTEETTSIINLQAEPKSIDIHMRKRKLDALNERSTMPSKKKKASITLDKSFPKVDQFKPPKKKGTSITDFQALPKSIDIKMRKRKLDASKKTSITPSQKQEVSITLDKNIFKVDQFKSTNKVNMKKSDIKKKEKKRKMELSQSDNLTNSSKLEASLVRDEISTFKQRDKKRKHDLEIIATKSDLVSFISADSYPGLDKLQWKILTTTAKKFVSKLDKCASTDKQAHLLVKVNRFIRNATQWCHPSC